MSEEEVSSGSDGAQSPQPPERWAGTMRTDAAAGSGAWREGSGRPARGARHVRTALGSRGTGWVVAAFLAGAVVALLIVQLAGPSTAVFRPAAASAPIRTGPFNTGPARSDNLGGLPPGVRARGQAPWVQIRGMPAIRRTLTIPGGTVFPGGVTVHGRLLLPPGGVPGWSMPMPAGGYCQAAMGPAVIRGRAGRVQVVRPKAAGHTWFTKRGAVQVPAGYPPFAVLPPGGVPPGAITVLPGWGLPALLGPGGLVCAAPAQFLP